MFTLVEKIKVESSIAVPVLVDGTLYGVWGVAKPVSYDFTDEESTDLLSIGAAIGKVIEKKQNLLNTTIDLAQKF